MSPGPAVGLVLAAGAGRRIGGPKALLELGGRPLLAGAVELLRAGGCARVVVVVGAAAEQVSALAASLGADVVLAPDWESGMAASLRSGLEALADGPEEVAVVALVDQPLLGAGSVRRLLAARGPAAVATYDGRPRNPVRLDREIWSAVSASVHGDAGARTWLAAHPDLVTAVACDGTGRPDDVDTPQQLADLVGTVPKHEESA